MNVRNRDLGSFIAEAQQRVGQSVKMPVGYDLLWGGEFENQQRAMKRLTLVLPLALLLTFLLLFSAFGTRLGRGDHPAQHARSRCSAASLGLGVVRHDALGLGRRRLHRPARPGRAQRRARGRRRSAARLDRGEDLLDRDDRAAPATACAPC